MVKRAVCVGINDYPGSGNDLSGCVNDALGWQTLLTGQGYQYTSLLNDGATRRNVLDALEDAVAQSRFGDRIVFTYSGHGSWVPDTSGDETDRRDECLVAYDWQNSGYIVDDELQQIWDKRRFGVRVVTFSDSCHSGTVSRFVGEYPTYLHARYFPTELLVPRRYVPQRRTGLRSTGTVLVSGCDDPEYSYDAFIEGRAQGAFSWAALDTWHALLMDKGQAPQIGPWHKAIRGRLPSEDYPQTPQLDASAWQRRWVL